MFLIKILINSLLNGSYLFIHLRRIKLLIKYELLQSISWISSTFELLNERLFLRACYL